MPLAFAKVQNSEYRSCMQQGVSRYYGTIAQNQRTYEDALVSAMERRKEAYVDAWNNEDDKDMNAALRDAGRQYYEETRDARKVKSDADREAGKAYSADRKVCSPLKYPKSSSSSSSSSTSSSRSSSSSRSMCDDIVCSDGRRLPTCIFTAQGIAVIDYAQDPCSQPRW